MTKPLIIFALHPKVGTALCHLTIEYICDKNTYKSIIGENHPIYNEPKYSYVFSSDQSQIRDDVDIWLSLTSKINEADISRPFCGVHFRRDPRAMIVSGYIFILSAMKTKPNKENKFYRLLSMSEEEGIIYYLKEYAYDHIMDLYNWNYNNPKFLEVKYEDVITNFDQEWTKIFNFININPVHLKIAQMNDINRLKTKEIEQNNHITNKNINLNLWKEHFTPRIIKEFKDLFPQDLLQKLQYPNFD